MITRRSGCGNGSFRSLLLVVLLEREVCMIADVYLAGLARTAIGSFGGAFAEVPATTLGSAVIRAALQRAGVDPARVDEVIMGNVLTAGLGQNPARQAAIGAGVPSSAGATTVAKVCGSGLKAVMLAAQAIQ